MSIMISLKFVPKGPIDNIPSIGSDNGLAPSRPWGIIWTNDVLFTGAYMRHSASLIKFVFQILVTGLTALSFYPKIGNYSNTFWWITCLDCKPVLWSSLSNQQL